MWLLPLMRPQGHTGFQKQSKNRIFHRLTSIFTHSNISEVLSVKRFSNILRLQVGETVDTIPFVLYFRRLGGSNRLL